MDAPETEQNLQEMEERLLEAQHEMGQSEGHGKAQWVNDGLRLVAQIKFCGNKLDNKVNEFFSD